MDRSLAASIESALGIAPRAIRRLGGDHGAGAHAVDLTGGERVVVKAAERPDAGLTIEGFMLRELARLSALPVPGVLYCDDALLIMDWIDGHSGGLSPGAQRQAAELLAALHSVTAAQYGYARDTVIGGLPQPNGQSPTWRAFFRDRRLCAMADTAMACGRLDGQTRARIDRLAARLHEWLDEPDAPGLLHGDAWGGNILSRDDRVTGFIDPAIYFGDPEIELAFGTLFHTFDQHFFARYQEIRPLAPGFFEVRCDLYNLYPLLVHVRLFGASYLPSVERILTRFGL